MPRRANALGWPGRCRGAGHFALRPSARVAVEPTVEFVDWGVFPTPMSVKGQGRNFDAGDPSGRVDWRSVVDVELPVCGPRGNASGERMRHDHVIVSSWRGRPIRGEHVCAGVLVGQVFSDDLLVTCPSSRFRNHLHPPVTEPVVPRIALRFCAANRMICHCCK